VRPDGELGNVERAALACPALPTCGQALTEAERRLPELVGNIEGALASRQLGRRALQLRMTGCPNGCARPAVAEVGIVGRTKSTYDVFVGGGPRGDRLATLYREKVPFDEIAVVLGPLFDRWEVEGDDDESFGDFISRVGVE
jgi:sulfite reductase beta subunit-like hemoprotein